MLGHSQPITSDAWIAGTSKRFSVSYPAYADLIRSALYGTSPRPRHSKLRRSSNTSATSALALRLPSRETTRVYSFSTSCRPSLSWRISISADCMTSSGSKPAITTGRWNSSAKNS